MAQALNMVWLHSKHIKVASGTDCSDHIQNWFGMHVTIYTVHVACYVIWIWIFYVDKRQEVSAELQAVCISELKGMTEEGFLIKT